MLDETIEASGAVAPSSDPQGALEEQAQAYLEEQEKSIREAYNASAITIVLSLMPADDHPQGRLAFLSVKNDTDAPLFGPPLHEDEVSSLLEFAPVEELIESLKTLLPQRLKERKEKEQRLSQQSASQSSRPTGAQAGKKSSHKQTAANSNAGGLPLTSSTGGNEVTATGTTNTSDPTTAPESEVIPPQITPPAPSNLKTTQLTLF